MPLGTTIHNIEITLGKGEQLARATSVVAKLIAKEGKSATLKLPSGEVRLISKNCSATVGQVGNVGGSGINGRYYWKDSSLDNRYCNWYYCNWFNRHFLLWFIFRIGFVLVIIG
ncbi:hypothetical protein JRO89_XS02G0249100 [Xanthoceras sorbifolium]|uniref:Large ribosomal subunit protein uL2 C-terminal domain-containing protein n=1 Tax=Xanthoceras sorbifolium TaxID=99658 RepID=A0ABQ8IGU3_9ROSI|nr:hypothetical protein JRO89_XS02G0249100 [Xanthoceras sorbifolium]